MVKKQLHLISEMFSVGAQTNNAFLFIRSRLCAVT